MRNLTLFRNIIIKDPFLKSLKKCLIVSESSTSKSTKLFIFNEYIELYQLNIKDDLSFEETFVLDLFQFIDEPSEPVTVAGFNCVFNEVYVILSHGYLISIVITGDDEDNEAFGQSLEVGATKIASWSPDFERTVLINREDKLFILNIVNTDVEKLNEISLQDAAEEQNKFVNVGWGSVETQFRGSEGKFAKSAGEVVAEEVTDVGVRVCWKQNATAFAVSYVCRAENRRKIKVFSQDGVLLNATNDIFGLHAAVDWSPSRNLIFCPQTLPNKRVVCCIEPNGLRHGDFEIPDGSGVRELLWNSNGSVLASHAVLDGRDSITLWTTSNYKWYAKQHLRFDEAVIYAQWDFVSPTRLHVVLHSGVYRSYEWRLQVDESGRYGGAASKAVVAVVNGRKLGATPYALVSQPPSMPFKSYDLSPAYANAVIFPATRWAGDFDSDSMIVYTSANSLLVLKFDDQTGTDLRLNCAEAPIRWSTPAELSAFAWISPDRLLFSWCRADGHHLCVSRLDLADGTATVERTFRTDSPILATCGYQADALVHLDDGTVLLYREDGLHSMTTFVEPCVRLQMLGPDTLMALSENRNLYANETIERRDVASFYWKPPFVVTLTADSLHVSKVNVGGGRTTLDELLSRAVEPKSYLVTVVDDRVLLETERGNLETIVPRPFSILRMEELLKSRRYLEAFEMLRKQRINLNVLFDHDADAFLNDLEAVVGRVSDPTYWLHFVTELEDGNVAAAMFPWRYSNGEAVPRKVDTVCRAFCSAVERLDDGRLTVPLIAALVKRNKLAEAAAYAIRRDQLPALAQLCDPVAVYRAALAADELAHALRVVQYSKLDPSEYLPFVQELRTLEQNYRKFRICDYLQNYAEAVTYLAGCDDDDKFEQCVAYARKHRLWRTAVEAYAARSGESAALRARYVRVLTAAADEYADGGSPLDAAILFEKAAAYDRAFGCYAAAGDWSAAMAVSRYAHADAESAARASRDVYDALMRQRKFEEAGFVGHHFVADGQLAVDAYLAARKFCGAVKAARGLKSDERVWRAIRAALVEETRSAMSGQKAKLATLAAYRDRLEVIREMRKQPDGGNDEDDRQSVISSDGSESSALSGSSKASAASSTAKRARRRERRLWNLKPGNRREEPSLLNAIRQAVTQHEKEYREAVPDLIEALVRTDEFALASELKTFYEEFVASMRKIVDATWSEASLPEDGAGFQDILVTCPPEVASFKSDLIFINCK